MHSDSNSPSAPLPNKPSADNPFTDLWSAEDPDNLGSPQEALSRAAKSAESWLLDVGTLIAQRLLFALLVMLFIIYVTFLGMAMAHGLPLSVAASDAFSSSIAYLHRLSTGDMGMSHAVSSRLNPTVRR